ncbi:MAG: hypothetical protein V1773_10220 [bacterium]
MEIEKKELSPDIIAKLIEFSNGCLTATEMDLIISLLNNYFAKVNFSSVAENNFLRIITSLFDKISFLRSSITYNHYFEYIILISANSNYLTDIIVRNPEYLYLLYNSDFLNKKITVKDLDLEIKNSICNYKSFDSKSNYLRLLKRKYFLKIGLNDIINNLDVYNTTQALSNIAISISKCLFNLCFEFVKQKYNLSNFSRKYVLASLGKLGGNELNYSSDIDLILFYDKNLPVCRSSKLSAKDFFNEVIFLFIKTATLITEKGYIYRVDFRLRPEGRNSSLSKSINDHCLYYDTRGEDWERQMLLKLNFVCGSRPLFTKFLNFSQSYIFAKSIFVSPLSQIKTMKKRIEIGNDNDIKLCVGGIRDIEFSLQALQLINGAKYKILYDGNSLNVMIKLFSLNIITSDEYIFLSSAYNFYRKVEHYLQLMNDRQTHSIPNDINLLNSMIMFFGLKDEKDFYKVLNTHKANVRSFFISVFNEPESINITQTSIFENIRFKDKNRSVKNINFLRFGTDLFETKGFDSITIDLFKEIEEPISRYLLNCSMPDIVLENFVRGIKSVFFPSIWYTGFKDNNFLTRYLVLCEYSTRFFNMWMLNKKLGDFLLTGRIFIKEYIHQDKNLRIDEILFILSGQFALNIINAVEFSEILTIIIKSKIDRLYSAQNISCFTVFALGSFGISTMNFGSDIDLMFVSNIGANSLNVNKTAEKFIGLLNLELAPLKLDFRLRPEGKSSQIVWDIESFSKYLNNRARIWEFVALQKIKFVVGSFNLYSIVLNNFLSKIKEFKTAIIKEAVMELYKTLINNNKTYLENTKFTKGTLVDIHFCQQLLFFYKPDIQQDTLDKTFYKRFNYLINYISTNDLNVLIKNYDFLKRLEISIQNIFGVNNSNLPIDNEKLLLLTKFLDIDSIEKFRLTYNHAIITNQKILSKYQEIWNETAN